MSIQTIYRCDRCGAEQEEAEQFWTVSIGVNEGTHAPSCTQLVLGKSIQVCRSCLEELGIYDHRSDATKAKAPPVPSVENLILQILELVEER